MVKNGFTNFGDLIHIMPKDGLNTVQPMNQIQEIVNKLEAIVNKLDDMRARWDLNPRPTASEAVTLSIFRTIASFALRYEP